MLPADSILHDTIYPPHITMRYQNLPYKEQGENLLGPYPMATNSENSKSDRIVQIEDVY